MLRPPLEVDVGHSEGSSRLHLMQVYSHNMRCLNSTEVKLLRLDVQPLAYAERLPVFG